MMKALTLSHDKSLHWSFGVHAGLLLIAFMPLAHKVMERESTEYILEIGYQEIPEEIASGSEGLQARSPIYNDEPEPTSDRLAEEIIPINDDQPVEDIKIAETNSDIESEVVMDSDINVVASAPGADGSDSETSANGGGEGSPIEGDQDGAAMEGDGGGGDGLEGDGIITRKIIYRENITGAAKISGRITLNVCIDRAGRVIYAAYDPEKTTITDNEIIRQASILALRYRYEAKYNAPQRECGQLTFIFSIDDDVVSK